MSSITYKEKAKNSYLTYRQQLLVGKIIRVAVLCVLVVFALFPALWVLSASFNPSQSMTSQSFIPRNVNSIDDLLKNYNQLLNTPRYPFWRWLGNSVVVASITSFLTVMITALSAYSFSRFRFKGRQGLLLFILLVQVFPNLLAMVAIFLILQQIGNHLPFLGLNTVGGLILVYVGGAMGINIWLMKGFFDSVPRDIDESALVDGANHWQTYWMLIFPLVRPILIVVGILSFVGTFNEFVLARVLLRDRDAWTLMVGLWGFVSDNFGQNWGIFAAGSVIGAMPTLIVYLFFQDQIVGGLTQGAVKG
jgi:ABC-type maltose transport system permease subunit